MAQTNIQDRKIKRTRLKIRLRKQLGKSSKIATCYEALIFIKSYPQKSKSVLSLAAKRLFSRKKYIFLFASPTHGNRGDQLIAYSIKKWCEKYFPLYVFVEYDDSILRDWSFLSLLKSVINKHDLILLRGGGSVGDWYIDYEYFIRHVLKMYTKNKIVMFPQSVNFSDTPFGREEKLNTAFSYDNHPDFTFYARDEISFEIAKTMLKRSKVQLCPDIAMFLFNLHALQPCDRSGVFLCLRTDKNEIHYSNLERNQIVETIAHKYSVRFGDTEAGHKIFLEQREEEIEKMLRLFSESTVTVTDRYHGMISAVLTKTPCVVLRSADHKIVSGIKWFEGLDYVFYAENIDDVPALIEKAMLCENPMVPAFSNYFNELYEEIINEQAKG
ncbi:MAG: hypothetical protein GXZ02_06560 [Clostridiales bacterium]|nr:hypothetical protein [Clostridiales bacterium]